MICTNGLLEMFATQHQLPKASRYPTLTELLRHTRFASKIVFLNIIQWHMYTANLSIVHVQTICAI